MFYTKQHQEIPVYSTTENGKTHIETGAVKGETNNESIKKNIEIPLFLIAGVANVLIGLWILLGKKSSRILYILSIVGSRILITLYWISIYHWIDYVSNRTYIYIGYIYSISASRNNCLFNLYNKIIT
ncbi:MAG: hypothetical protein M3Z01_07980 [Thermoproteota archaeon]|nr:hypothetical protein [Thermoproteota archaeon]